MMACDWQRVLSDVFQPTSFSLGLAAFLRAGADCIAWCGQHVVGFAPKMDGIGAGCDLL